jgi:outer membrane protein assembly factor BamB
MRPLLLSLVLIPVVASAENWPNWRGPQGTGVSGEKQLPLTWSATENVKWKVPLPEAGNSSPIVWKDRIFIAQNAGQRRTVMAFDRKDGKILWQAGPTYSEKERTHPTNPYCSASPVTDGERVIAWFGSAGLWCWDRDGKEQWHLDLGKQDHEWGYASSPVIHGDTCFLNFGPGERTFLLAVDKRTGKEIWRNDIALISPKLPRNDGFGAAADGMTGSWCTPLIVPGKKGASLLMTWPEKVTAYDPATGRERWSTEGINPLIYTSTMAGEGVIIGSGGYGGSTVAVKEADSGSKAEQLWFKARDKQRIGSGVVTGGHLYILNTPGTAQCIDLQTGKTVWEERLVGSTAKGESWSSMLLAGDRIYVPNQASDTFVLRAAPKFERLALNTLDDGLNNSSFAASDGDLFLRTHKHLWCIGTPR